MHGLVQPRDRVRFERGERDARTELYHLADAVNVASIRRDGLRSASDLIAACNFDAAERAALVRRHRSDLVTLPSGVVLRDQRPMPPHLLARVLDGGLTPGDWYALINGFVFFWPDRARLARLSAAYRRRPQQVLVFDRARLLADFAPNVRWSPINSGNARRRAARRGPHTFAPLPEHDRRIARAAEIVIDIPVPATRPYLVRIEEPY